MTESSFPFDQTAPSSMEDPTESGRRKPAVIVGGLVGAMVLAAGGYFFLAGGSAEEDDFSVPVRPPQAAAPAESEAAPIEVVPVATSEVVGRNPFKVLYSDTSGGAVAAGGSGTTTPPVTTPEIIEQSKPKPVVQQPAPVAPAPAPVAPPKPGTAPAPQPPAPAPEPEPEPMPEDDGVRYPITLMAIDVRLEEQTFIAWGFDGKGFEVLPGEPFGRFRHLRVMQIVDEPDRQGVMLQMGDSAPYFVKLGDTVYVL